MDGWLIFFIPEWIPSFSSSFVFFLVETFAKLSDRSEESEMLAWTTSANTKKKICRLYISTISLHSMSGFVLSLLDNAPNYIVGCIIQKRMFWRKIKKYKMKNWKKTLSFLICICKIFNMANFEAFLSSIKLSTNFKICMSDKSSHIKNMPHFLWSKKYLIIYISIPYHI